MFGFVVIALLVAHYLDGTLPLPCFPYLSALRDSAIVHFYCSWVLFKPLLEGLVLWSWRSFGASLEHLGGGVGGLGSVLGCSWVPLEGSGTALGRVPGGSWQALGGFQKASWTKDRDS